MSETEAIETLKPILYNGVTFGTNEHYEALDVVLSNYRFEPERWHHPGTDKRGHLTTECTERGCTATTPDVKLQGA